MNSAFNNLSRQFNSDNDNAPIYRQLTDALESIINKEYQPGSYLPSENELAEYFSVNRHTVRRALDELVNAGLILRQQGKGSLVINNSIEYAFNTGRFTASLDKLRISSASQVIKSDIIHCNQKVADYLNIEVGEEVTVIETLRSVNDQPVSIISHFLNKKILPDIELHYQSGSLHNCIEKHYGIQLIRSSALISATMPNQDDAFYLKCPSNRPLLKIKSFNTNKEKTQQMVEFSISRNRSDRFQIKI